jgi:hypothetical protein
VPARRAQQIAAATLEVRNTVCMYVEAEGFMQCSCLPKATLLRIIPTSSELRYQQWHKACAWDVLPITNSSKRLCSFPLVRMLENN